MKTRLLSVTLSIALVLAIAPVEMFGQTKYVPNSTFTIAPPDSLNKNIRPTRFVVADVDNDGIDEVIFSDRKGNDAGYYFGVASVSDVPDDADGSETWTLEVSGKDFGDLTAEPIENKWDVAVIDSNIYTFCEVEISKLSYANGSWSYTALTPIAGGASFISAQVVDLDDDGTEEIIAGTYDWNDDNEKGVYLLQEDGDTLIHTKLADTTLVGTGERLIGGASGDIDQDGYLDFVFGTRYGEPDGAIYRLAYRGGTITDPANYEMTIIDSAFGESGIWSVINIANIDADAELEVLYTSSVPVGGLISGAADIAVLDYSAGAFTRSTITLPEKDLNVGGAGGMISGVDLDGDSNLEIYLVNDNWNDAPSELIPRIYKLEYDGSAWSVVWSAISQVPKQNTWPALAIGDLDGDSKSELLWGIVNATGTGNENPARISVYEEAGDGTDVMGVEDPLATDSRSVAPIGFTLHQNYPNPFNPATRLSFEISQATFTTLTVYDIVGREVVTLVNGHLASGPYNLVWDGRHADGHSMSTGVYLARLSTTEHSQTIKMILMK
ncbi:MAG: T9SS type A sorting domain-containing protein [Candidatus Marinimicrobia bacterium]|nr:T9SS type A sorting domain-containing protein [Candidatus Neomarinimicrobiota bacterium]